MTVAAVEGLAPERASNSIQLDWPLMLTVFGAILMIAAAVASAPISQFRQYVDERTLRAIGGSAFAIAMTLPVIFSWRRAIRDNQLPAKRGLEPQYEHVNGWNAIFLFVVVLLIGWIVWWASQGDEENQTIHAQWGIWVVLGLTVAFVMVAAAPLVPRTIRALRLEKSATSVSSLLNAPVEFLGKFLSAVDSLLVFAVANSAGTNRKNFFLRYGLLLSVIGACAVLGYFWPPPWAFVPIGWGFLVAFAVSRRWAWIEQDRELAMLNSTISQAHIRVGFGQNLRDEALTAFLSMFLLVPLALRQAQVLAQDNDIVLFALAPGADIDSVSTWIAFYGTELAKAVPFVDWAEIYHVEGAAPVRVESDYAQHAVFLTRVLIDLVFLAALLQAISSASRDAQQRDLFYRKQSIHRLDPFTEPDAFRGLVRKSSEGKWEANGEKLNDFPHHYDPNRLVELTSSDDERVAAAATLLRERDGVGNDPHYQLSAATAERDVAPERITVLLDAIENAGPARNPYQLALTRRRLLGRRNMRAVRGRIVTMIAQGSHSFERTDRLVEAMVGEQREGYAQERGIALDALASAISTNLRVEAAVKQVAEHDTSGPLKARAKKILDGHKPEA
jgi:hypothetical protein